MERTIRKDDRISKILKYHHADLTRRIIYEAYKQKLALTVRCYLNNSVMTRTSIAAKVHCGHFCEKIGFRFHVINESPRMEKKNI